MIPRSTIAILFTLMATTGVAVPPISLGTETPSMAPVTEGWDADWIGVVGGSKPNTWICFRRQFEIGEVPESVVARVSCDSKYWMWINGELAVFEGQLKRGPTPTDTYFDEVEIAPHLAEGTNTIAILVCHFGRHGFSHNSSGKAGLLFEAHWPGGGLVSDGSWRAKVHPAFGTTDPPLDNVRPPEANIRFDARHDIGNWQSANYDDSEWGPPTIFGRPPIAPWNNLHPRPIPHWKDSGLVAYERREEMPTDDNGVKLVGHLPYNCHVSPYLKVDAPAGKVIKIHTDILDLYGRIPLVETHRHEYVTRAGEQAFELPFWINGHDVHYMIPDGVRVLDVKYRETGYDTDVLGHFQCDDDKLNQLWEESKRTLYVTMRDTYMDCPDRERAQWWGDAVNELGEAFYVFEQQRSPLLAKKAIYELVRWQRPDDTLYSPVPSGIRRDGILHPLDGSWDQELPRQMLASVGWYGFWTYYWYTGDRETIVDAYPAVKRYMSLWKLGDDGLVVHRTGGWDWTDWGENRDAAVIENAWVYLAMKAAIEMAELTGNQQDIAGYQKVMTSIEANFNKTFWQGDKYRAPDYHLETDDRANAMAVVAGLADPTYYPAIREVLEQEHHASPYMEKYVLESLLMMNAPDQAMDRMKQRYEAMLEDDKTTLWEMFDEMVLPGFGSLGRGTYNHAWSGGPLTIMSQYIAGVAPTAPAFREYQVLPQLGRLQRVDVVVPTQHGLIKVIHQQSENSYSLQLESPDNTLATVGIPVSAVSSESTIQVDGDDSGETAVERIRQDDHYVYYRVPPGKWSFSVD